MLLNNDAIGNILRRCYKLAFFFSYKKAESYNKAIFYFILQHFANIRIFVLLFFTNLVPQEK